MSMKDVQQDTEVALHSDSGSEANTSGDLHTTFELVKAETDGKSQRTQAKVDEQRTQFHEMQVVVPQCGFHR